MISEKSKKKINSIINEIGQLSDIEKLLLYLQLPSGTSYDIDPLKQKGPGNPFGKKADVEVAQTWTWIQSHLEEDPSTSLPKHEVYEEYRCFCQASKFEPLCVADFGKAMKQIFPRVKPRRLGQRGNSKYCYSGLKKKLVVESPSLPDLDLLRTDDEKCNSSLNGEETEKVLSEDFTSVQVVVEWAEKFFSQQFKTIKDLGRYLIDAEYVDNTSVAALTMISSVDDKQQNKLILKKTVSRGSKRDAQIHLQRKFHQKEPIHEQKKKVDLNKTTSVTKNVPVSVTTKSGSNKKSKKTTSNLEPSRPLVKFPSNEIKLKVEKTDDNLIDHRSKTDCVETHKVQNKIPIPRTVAPQVSNQLSTASFIVLPGIPTGVRLASSTQNQTNETSNTQAVSVIPSSPVKSASKYKRIQPKPLPVNRSNSAIEALVTSSASNSSLDSNDNFDSNIKRRHSVSVPIASDNKHVQFEGAQEKQIKRHIDEKDINVSVSKKRLVDNNGNMYLQPTNSDEVLSSASLSPVSQPEQQGLSKQVTECGRQSLIVQDLEQDCLREYFHETGTLANDCWDSSPEKISQLRKILEEKLPQTPSKNGEQKQQLQGFSELRQTLMRKTLKHTFTQSGNAIDSSETQLSNNFSTSRSTTVSASPLMNTVTCTNLNGSSQYDINSLPSMSTAVHTITGNLLSTNVQTQFPSVPPSPNTRRRAFSFQPISPRNTPTIPENSSVSSSAYGSISSTSSGLSPPQYHNNQHSIAVGPSQSPSAANSPFVSPRSTPIPLSRSRHNSGQSTYSTSRQTPFQNFDSGVSSVSNSPFISPQSTPVPISRVRVGSNGMQMRSTTLRARHSSGPGNPYTSVHHNFASAVASRSSSLSPMVCSDTDVVKNGQLIGNQVVVIKTEPNVFSHGYSSGNNGIPISPLSNPMSPNAASVDNHSLCGELFLKESLSAIPSERQRHLSSPYTISPSTPVTSNGDSQEIQNLLKNFVLGDLNEHNSVGKVMLSRSHSVPVHQMKLLETIRGSNDSPVNLKTGRVFEENIFISKSYPATPLCNQSFQFPPSPPSSSSKLQSSLVSEDVSTSFLQSGHDVMVSGGLQSSWTPGVTANSEINGDNELIAASDTRQNLNDLLTAAPPMEDELQTALEDLRDCDSEFSKFAQELELMEANDGPNAEDLS
ncbi:uncharacterized protein B4U80_10324 [Leptotrombidium deliense]|uniref:RFX-type winged-helix domain-containing protein n=1 Tax=Leptotrombidium deliense TaxID=299467 RepID=A0A443SUH5_9ACAR|nr:uncharacterized protein B4U80_10324 [Leptotrombidium deliense]